MGGLVGVLAHLLEDIADLRLHLGVDFIDVVHLVHTTQTHHQAQQRHRCVDHGIGEASTQLKCWIGCVMLADSGSVRLFYRHWVGVFSIRCCTELRIAKGHLIRS